jgi:hypothetical protein
VKFNGLGIPVRIVIPQFYPTLFLEGWNKVQGWIKATGFMEINWQTALIILVPIFTGYIFAGHWSGFTDDRMIQIGATGIRVYKDSLPPQWASNDLKTRLSPTPLVEDTSIWVNSRHSSGTRYRKLEAKIVMSGCAAVSPHIVLAIDSSRVSQSLRATYSLPVRVWYSTGIFLL